MKTQTLFMLSLYVVGVPRELSGLAPGFGTTFFQVPVLFNVSSVGSLEDNMFNKHEFDLSPSFQYFLLLSDLHRKSRGVVP